MDFMSLFTKSVVSRNESPAPKDDIDKAFDEDDDDDDKPPSRAPSPQPVPPPATSTEPTAPDPEPVKPPPEEPPPEDAAPAAVPPRLIVIVRHTRARRDATESHEKISKRGLRWLGRRAGIIRISHDFYTYQRKYLRTFIDTVVSKAILYAQNARRKIVAPQDVCAALRFVGVQFYG